MEEKLVDNKNNTEQQPRPDVVSLGAQIGLGMAVFVSVTAISISIAGISGHLDQGGLCFYYSLLSSIVGLWSPSPASKFFMK